MIVILKFIACDRQVDFCVGYIGLPTFCELTSQEYVPKMRSRLIEKVLDVRSRRTFQLFHTFV